MQIIIVHPRWRRAKAVTVRKRWLLVAALGVAATMFAGSGLLSYVALNHAFEARWPIVQRWLAAAAGASSEHDAYVRQNIDALAVRLGRMQAELARLGAIGDRVAGMAGIKPSDLPRSAPGRGGPQHDAAPSLSLGELSAALEQVARGVEHHSDTLSVIESELMIRAAMQQLLPTSQPLVDGLPGSGFGWRIDPISGRSALHEGIDFNAPVGTPIVAAGAGVVVFAGWHPGYGMQLDIDHGGGLVTRYAHASKLLAKEGDIVRQGQKIAEVGSTGRSTGSHLHFEVRVRDEPHDPLKHLQSSVLRRSGPNLAGHGGKAASPR